MNCKAAVSYSNVNIEIKHTIVWTHIIESGTGSPFIPAFLSRKLRYQIVRNRLRNTQKRLYFDLKIANLLQRLEAKPLDPQGLRWPGQRNERIKLAALEQRRLALSTAA